MSAFRKSFVAAALVLSASFISTRGVGQGSVDPATAAALQAKLEQLRTSYAVKGMSATVTLPGQRVWKGVTGVSHGTVPIDTQMVLPIGSITKTLIATTVLKLQEENLLSISDSLHNWLPAYPNIDTTITIKQLLNHTSGIAEFYENQAYLTDVAADYGAFWTADQVLNNYILPPAANPGSIFWYSNTNYLLLSRIIEEATDTTWRYVVRNRISDPYQLNSIYAEQAEPSPYFMPHGWQVISGTYYDIDSFPKAAMWTSVEGAGQLASNAYDLAKFTELLLQGHILQPGSFAQMFDFVPGGGVGFNAYGLGLMRMNSLGQPVYGHGGTMPGFAAMAIYSPTDSVSVSVLINQQLHPISVGLDFLKEARQSLLNATQEAGKANKFSVYPNPISGKGMLNFALPESETVRISLVNLTGQEVLEIASGHLHQGEHSVPVNAQYLPSGVYLCRFETKNNLQVVKVIIH